MLVFQLYDVFQSSQCALASLSLANMERFVLIISALLEQYRIETLVATVDPKTQGETGFWGI